MDHSPTADSATPSAILNEAGANLLEQSSNWVMRNRRWIFLGIVLLYVAGFNGTWNISPDSSIFAGVGRNLAEGKGYVFNHEHHRWVEPGTPYLVSLTFRALGRTDQFWLVMLSELLCAAGAATAMYFVFRRVMGAPVATVLVALLCLSETFFRYAYTLFTDMPFLLWLTVFLLAYEWVAGDRLTPRWQTTLGWALVPLSVFMMAAFRPVVWTMSAAIVAGSLWNILWNRRRAAHVGLMLMLIVAFVAFRAVDPRRSSAADKSYAEAKMSNLLLHRTGFMVHRTATQFVPKLIDETVIKALFGVEFIPGVDSVATFAVLAMATAIVTRRPMWGLMVLATLGQTIIHLPRERYLLPILPFLLLGIWKALSLAEARLRPKWASGVVAGTLALLVGCNLVLILRFIKQQHETPMFQPIALREQEGMYELAKAVRDHVPAYATVILKDDRTLHYFSNAHTVKPIQASRVPPLPEDEAKFEAQLFAEKELWVVLFRRDKVTRALVDKMGLDLAPAVNEGERYPLHKVIGILPPEQRAAVTQPAALEASPDAEPDE